jgi:hypothetical protein
MAKNNWKNYLKADPTDWLREERSSAARDFLKKAAEYFLQHHIFKRSHNLGKIAKEEWTTLDFPLM